MKMILRHRCLGCGKEVRSEIDADPAQMQLPTAPDAAIMKSGVWQQSWGMHRCDHINVGVLLFLGILLGGE